ncbi:palmitoyltransferase akr1, partial [Linderina macrospora]
MPNDDTGTGAIGASSSVTTPLLPEESSDTGDRQPTTARSPPFKPTKAAAQSALNTEGVTAAIESANTPAQKQQQQQQPGSKHGDAYLEAASSNNLEIVKQCIEVHGVPADYADEDGNTALHFAAQEAAMGVLHYLVEERKVNINVRSGNFKAPPLFWAISAQRMNVIMYLLDHGANAGLQDSTGNSALHVAIHSGSVPITIYIACTQCAVLGYTVDLVDANGITPLMWACYQGKPELAALLVRLGADVNKQDLRGQTSLYFALIRGGYSDIDFLLEKGADPNLREYGSGDAASPTGNTAFDLAASIGYKAEFDKQVKRAQEQLAAAASGPTVFNRSIRKEIAPALMALGGVSLALVAISLYPWFVGVFMGIAILAAMHFTVVKYIVKAPGIHYLQQTPYLSAIFQSSALL